MRSLTFAAQVLWLDTNNINDIPETLLRMSALVNLHISGNPMRTPPYTVRVAVHGRLPCEAPTYASPVQVAALGITAIRKYYSDRNTRINRLMRLLMDCGVGTDRNGVHSNSVSGFLNDGLGCVILACCGCNPYEISNVVTFTLAWADI